MQELCEALRIGRRALDYRRKAGTLGIPEINIGGEGRAAIIRFRLRDVEAYLRGRTV